MLFKKVNFEKSITQYFSTLRLEEATWLTLSVNQNESTSEIKNQLFTAQIEVHEKSCLHTLKIKIIDTKVFIEAWSGKRSKFIGEASHSIFFELFSPFFDSFMQKVRSNLISMSEVKSTQSINPTNEGQGLEWLKTSINVLKNAIDQAFSLEEESSSEERNHLTLLLFSGLHPSTKVPTLRIRVFNLDFELIEDKTRTLRLSVFNKGRSETFNGIEPTFAGFFTDSKQSISNQFIQLLTPLASAFYINGWKKLP